MIWNRWDDGIPMKDNDEGLMNDMGVGTSLRDECGGSREPMVVRLGL